MKKNFNIKNILALLFLMLITSLVGITVVTFDPFNVIPSKQVNVEKIVVDSIPYAVHDTIPYEVEVEVEVPVEVRVPVEVIVTQPVDTMAILKDFYIKNTVKEELLLPNNQGKLFLSQIVTQNKIVSTEFNVDIKPRVKKDTILLPEPKKSQLYFGIVSGITQKDMISNIGAGLLFKTKEDKIFKLTGGVANRLETTTTGSFYPYLEGGVFWKIKTKKSRY